MLTKGRSAFALVALVLLELGCSRERPATKLPAIKLGEWSVSSANVASQVCLMSDNEIRRRFGIVADYGCGVATFEAGPGSFHVIAECRDLDDHVVQTDTRLHGDFGLQFEYERQLKTLRPDDLYPQIHQQRATYHYLGPCSEDEL